MTNSEFRGQATAVTSTNTLNVSCVSGCSGAPAGQGTPVYSTSTLFATIVSTFSTSNPGYVQFVTSQPVNAFLMAGVAEIGNVKNSGTFAVQAAQSGNWTMQPSSFTIYAPNNNTTAIPVSGSFSANGSTLSIVGLNNSANIPVVLASTGAVSISTGSVTSFQGGTWTVGLSASQTVGLAAGSARVGEVTVTTGSVSAFLATGTNEIGNVKNSGTFAVQAAQGAAGSTAWPVVLASTGAVSVSTGSISAAQMGTWTVQPGNTANTTPWLVNHASTAAVSVATGSVTSFQGGTWTVQPGNTANTTPWLTNLTSTAAVSVATGSVSAFQGGSWTNAVSTGSISAIASLGNTNFGKTVVWVTSSAVLSAVNSSTLVLSSRTVATGKTFYVQHWDVNAAWGNNTSSNTTNLGSVQVQEYLTGNTVVSSMTFTSGFAQPMTFWKQDYAEPVPILVNRTFAITIKPNTATATQWTSNVVGYER